MHFDSIQTLVDPPFEYLECVEVVQAPQKRGKISPALKELNKCLKENADLLVVCLDVLEVQDLPTNARLQKRLSKLKERNVLFVIVDAGIMYETDEDISQLEERVLQTLKTWFDKDSPA